MNNIISIIRVVLFVLFGAYEVWAFRNKRTILGKLLPMIFGTATGLILMVVAPFTTIAVFLMLFVILFVEISMIAAMLVVVSEIILSLFGDSLNIKRIIILSGVFIILFAVYFLGQKVF